MENTNKKIIFDYKNHDELIEELKLKEDNESKEVVKSFERMNTALSIGGLELFILCIVSCIIHLNELHCIVGMIIVLIPIIVGTALGRKYKKYVNQIKILEDALYYYSK